VIESSGTTLLRPAGAGDAPGAARTVVTARDREAFPDASAPEQAAGDPRQGFGAVARTILLTLAFTTLAFVLYLVLGTALQHHAAQTSRFAHFRGKLASGTAPISPVDDHGHALALGTPIAVLRIPSLGVHEVVGEGTTGGVLASGPGHLRSTVFPGGAGTSVIYGRASAYGGPFRSISHLHRGTTIEVTTGAGTSAFRVVDVRHAGDRIPALAAGRARLTLVTASGMSFVPSGVVLADADKVGAPLAAAAPPFSAVPPSEQPLGIDTSSLFALVLWLQALLLVVAGAVWAWHRRSPSHAWLLFFAPAAFVATEVAAQITHLLPNLL
jgi:sortase A